MKDINPYLPPASTVIHSASPEIEAIRRQHLGHETAIKAIGSAYQLIATILILMSIILIFSMSNLRLGFTTLALIGGTILFFLAQGLIALKNWVSAPMVILAIIQATIFPIGTIVSIFIFYLLLNKKGRFIFSPEYQDILKATHYLQYTTPWYVQLIFFGLLCLVIGSLIAF